MTTGRFIVLVVAALTCGSADVAAHGDVHLRITNLTEQIASSTNPRTNASLLFQRADLFRADGDWTNALVDLDLVARLDPSITRVEFCRGRVEFEAGRMEAALPPLNKYLATRPKDEEAYVTRARVLARLGSHRAAVNDYTTAISFGKPNPELYIERAEAWRVLGKPEEALRGLDEGIKKMGPLITLQLPAVDLEVALKRYDAALNRIDGMTARLQRKETWLVRRAEILRVAGREDEARKNYQDALAAIQRLPASHRDSRAMADLQARIHRALARP